MYSRRSMSTNFTSLFNSDYYSERNVFTGLELAALKPCKPTISAISNNVPAKVVM